MKNIFKSLAFVVAALMLAAIPLHAQANVVRTTISADIGTISSGQTSTISITSTTGMTASTNSLHYFILVDKEIMEVKSLSPFVVTRGEMGTPVSGHASGAYVFWGPVGTWSNNTGNTNGVFMANSDPVGLCTRTSNQYLPVFGAKSQKIYDCNGGNWVSDTLPIAVTASAVRQCTIPIGTPGIITADLTAYGTDATRATTSVFVASIDVTKARLVTGLSNLTGTTSPTVSLQLFSLYDSGGKLIASTPIAGVAAATADIFFDQLLTRSYGVAWTSGNILLPGRYFVGYSNSAATTTIQMIATADGRNGLLGGAVTTQTYGTLANLTLPTTLTTSAAPIMCTY